MTLQKYGKRRWICTILMMMVTLACMAVIYSQEFTVNVSRKDALAAAIGEYHFLDPMEVNVLKHEQRGSHLFVLYAQEGQEYHSGVAVLERGIFGRYRLCESSNTNNSLYHIRTITVGGQSYAVIYGRYALPGVVQYSIHEDGGGKRLYTGYSTSSPVFDVIETEGEWDSFADIVYWDADGNSLSYEELRPLYGVSKEANTSAVGSEGPWSVYGLMAAIFVLGASLSMGIQTGKTAGVRKS